MIVQLCCMTQISVLMSLSLVELRFDNLQSYLESVDSSYLPQPVWNIVSTGFPELYLIPSFLPSPPHALGSEDTIFGCPPRINLITFEGRDHIRAYAISYGFSLFLGAASGLGFCLLFRLIYYGWGPAVTNTDPSFRVKTGPLGVARRPVWDRGGGWHLLAHLSDGSSKNVLLWVCFWFYLFSHSASH